MQTDACDVRVGSVGLQQWRGGNNHEAQEQKQSFLPSGENKIPAPFSTETKQWNKTRDCRFGLWPVCVYARFVLTSLMGAVASDPHLKPKEFSSKGLTWLKSFKTNYSEVFGVLFCSSYLRVQSLKLQTLHVISRNTAKIEASSIPSPFWRVCCWITACRWALVWDPS